MVRDIVLQLSVRYCNNRGVINPENPEKKGGGGGGGGGERRGGGGGGGGVE